MKVLNALLVFFSFAFLLNGCTSGSTKEESFYVRGNCSMCKDRLETNVKKLKGVRRAIYDVDKQTLKVRYDSTKIQRPTVEQACANLGHGTETVPMNPKIHEALPICCQVQFNKGRP